MRCASLMFVLLLACGPGDDDDSATATGGPCATGTCEEDCDNGADDDGDGDIDCLDASCGALCPEDCDNGADDNGDWIVDCADASCASTCDADGDGSLGPQVGGPDCDDNDGSAYPGADEVWYDGSDNDCDPATVDDDQDSDGFSGNAEGTGEDCDDTSADTFPGAPETCGDDLVNDCDRLDMPVRDECFGQRSLATADHWFDGFLSSHQAGIGVAGTSRPPDAYGDVDARVVVGANGFSNNAGAAYVIDGPFARATDLSFVCGLEGELPDAFTGETVAGVPDLDGDNFRDVAVGARWMGIVSPDDRSGSVYVLHQSCNPGPIDNSAIELTGGDGDSLGAAIAAAEINGDGIPDLLIGAPERAFPFPYSGGVSVFAGPVDGPAETDDAWLTLVGGQQDARLGTSVASPGDLDGDGRDDFAAGAPFAGTGGVVFVINEPAPGVVFATDYVVLDLGDAGENFGELVVAESGDLSGDGRPDLVIGAPADAQGVAAGRVVVLDAVFPVPNVLLELSGAAGGDLFGKAGAVLDDVNLDGPRDLVIGAPGRDGSGPDAGAVYGFFGPFSGARNADDADVTLLGEADFDFAGFALSNAGDLDGDAIADLLIGAPYHTAIAPAGGRAYLFTFGY